MLDRTAIAILDTVNPATQVIFQPVPAGRFWWVHAADWFQFTGTIVGAAGFAFIFVSDPNRLRADVTMGIGVFETTDVNSICCTHAQSVNSTAGLGGGTAGGGGCGGFIVPQGHQVKMVTAATPGATTVFRGTVLYTEMDIGEEIPSVG